MDISTEQLDRILSDLFIEVARTFAVDGRGVVIEQIELEEEDK